MKKYQGIWPIDERAATPPSGWSGWPEGRRFALVLTHDVDTARGANRCSDLAAMEDSLGFRSSFNIVPERYPIPKDLRRSLTGKGFEVGVHDLNHDGKLFGSEKIFKERAEKINKYLEEWDSVGFRSASMLHNLEWIGILNIKYDASTFDTDPFEPQSDGMNTIFPFWVDGRNARRGYVELPYTLPQDFTLFVLMQEKTIDIWKKKLDWIAEVGGMALLNTHPDYMNFNKENLGLEEYPVDYYIDFLEYVKRAYGGQFFHALPREISCLF